MANSLANSSQGEGVAGGLQASATPEPVRRPGKPKGHPKPPGSGRKKGQQNRLTQLTKEFIAERGEPMKVLADIAYGRKLMRALPGDPTKRVAVYPTLDQSAEAAAILGRKTMPDLRAHEVTGAEGAPLIQQDTLSDMEVARRVAFLLTTADRAIRAGAAPAPELVVDNSPALHDLSKASALPPGPVPGDRIYECADSLVILGATKGEITIQRQADQYGTEQWLIEYQGGIKHGTRASRADAIAEVDRLIKEGRL